MSSGLTAMEKQLLAALLAGDDPVLLQLRRLSMGWKVDQRKWTGSGFFTYLASRRQ
jgi:hypothetical protein